MKPSHIVLLSLSLLVVGFVTAGFAQVNCTTQHMGSGLSTTNCSNGLSGTTTDLGNGLKSHNFNNGMSGTTHDLGGFSSSQSTLPQMNQPYQYRHRNPNQGRQTPDYAKPFNFYEDLGN